MSQSQKECIGCNGCRGFGISCYTPIRIKDLVCPCLTCIIKGVCREECIDYSMFYENCCNIIISEEMKNGRRLGNG